MKFANPRLFCLFSFFFSNTNFTEKTVDVSRMRTRIAVVEVEHADYLTTTTALKFATKGLFTLRQKHGIFALG